MPRSILLPRPFFALVLLCWSTLVCAEEATSFQDLDYGVAFFDLYQERYYSSAMNLGISLQQQKLRHHKEEAELLLGSMLLYYGMHDDAEALFTRHIQQQQSPVSDRAWFYMAKLRYQRGLYDAGLKALLNIQGQLPDELEHERYRLQVMLLMAQERFDLAAEASRQTQSPDDVFAQYNLAVALKKSGKTKESYRALYRLISLKIETPEAEMLQHKARIILAQTHLEYGNTENAIALLLQVPFDGVFADQALITLSWAYYKLGESASALAPLRLLKERNSTDIQAKEAWLLEGYIQEHASAQHEAKKSYNSAITHYQREINKLDEVIDSLGDGRFLDQLLPQLHGVSQGWGWEEHLDLPEGSGPYIAVILSRDHFFEALKNLHDLRYLSDQLLTWRDNMPSYQHMLKLRQTRYNEFLPLLALVKGNKHFESLIRQHQQLTQQLDDIDQQEAIYRLLDEKAIKQLDRLSQIEAALEILPKGELYDDYQQRYQHLKGLFIWDISASFKPRSWQRRKELRAQQQLLDSAAEKRKNLTKTKLTTPQMFSAYEAQINEMAYQIETLSQRIDQLYTLQEEDLLEQAADALQQYRNQLMLYRDQAYYRVAYIKDSALNTHQVQTTE